MAVCPVCSSHRSFVLDTRRDIPIAQNLIFYDRQAAKDCPVGQLSLVRCRDCGFAWNARFDAEKMRYDVTYDNDQNFSDVFRAHVESVGELVRRSAPDKGALSLLEVGCGQGYFLGVLARQFGPRLGRVIGFDPSWKGDRALVPEGAEILGEYYNRSSARRIRVRPDVIVSRHTIEHVPEPMPFLQAMREGCSDDTVVVLETPTIDWILENGVFFDVYYEHCSLFDPGSITIALELAGFEVEQVEVVFDGQYMTAVARPRPEGDSPPAPASREAGDLGYLQRRDQYLDSLRGIVRSARDEGGVALWGGASKGVTLALMLEADAALLTCAIDMNPRRHGAFLPGSGIPIVSPEQAAARGVRTAIVVNPAYENEVRAYCAEHALGLRIASVD